jgi:hyperosmotically inducible protein
MKTNFPKFFALLLSVTAVNALVSSRVVAADTTARESTGEYVDDTAITAKVKAAFVKDDIVRARDIKVATFHGTVQISGFANTLEEKTRAGTIARGIAGVRAVQNNITVK